MSQLGNFLDQIEEIAPIEVNNINRCAATHGRFSRSAFSQGGFTKTVARA